MKTKITELLGIEYPILQGGMAWVAEYHLASAVSEAGALGIIGAGGAPDFVREQVRKTKELTDKPFGVNVMLMNPEADAIAKMIVEEGVRVVTTGAGNPGKYMAMWKEAGVKVMPVVASVALAKMMDRCGDDHDAGASSGGRCKRSRNCSGRYRRWQRFCRGFDAGCRCGANRHQISGGEGVHSTRKL